MLTPMLDQQTHSQITDLSEACGRYWELRGIAQKRSKEMQQELEQHCIQAAMDGKSPASVVGSNPVAFAEAWARVMQPHPKHEGDLILPGLVTALGVVSTTALVEPLVAHTASFTLTLFTAYLLIGVGIASLLLPLAGFLALRIRTLTGRTVLLATVLVVGALIARSAGMRITWNMTLLSWGWPLTIVLIALTAGLFGLEVWRRGMQQQTDARFGRSLLTLVSNIVLLDLFLGMSSVIVFNACMLMCRI